ncbi:SH3 domain-containing protein [Noviherbaspirillum sedimenti]|uniref:SH3 domain-containing protein n=1 Tax=Noviherbaspirillum sedimenti TaxID=2320865 RepID=A0A3A3G193_9BURK|nr:SH3 domain-containing protein [Noviherbaspirillum sedimenti]RJG02203.1 SH3 domain-containing protein [Noviherbaspirillum sedimenti]
MRAHAFALLLVACAAQAEPALSNRATDVLAQPQSDAARLAALAESDKVEVLRRSGAWSEVRTGAGKTGWVRMMHLKPASAEGKPDVAAPNPAGALAKLLGAGRSGNTATVTTGVRGLQEEDLQNARSNPVEFQKMQKYTVSTEAGQAFARRSSLAPAQIGYLEERAPASAPARGGEMAPGMGGG